MKKLVRTNLTNTPSRRGTKDLNIQFYSHDKNNAGFEFVVKNETDLSQYTAKVLFKFRDSNSTWQANGTIEGNVVKVSFNTDLIARCEEVLGFLFLDSDSDSLDVFKFKFNVVLSEIDKNEVEKRRIKHIDNIESLEIVTRAELKDYLAKLQISGGVDLSNYLTTTEAEKIYATKNEIPSINGFVTTGDLTEAKKSVVEEITKLGYAKTTEIPAPYNDNELSKRVSNLEEKVDKDTVYDDSDLKNRVQALENRPTTASTSYDDSEVKRRLTELEKRPAGTSYDDKPLSDRVSALENKPEIDTSNFITENILTEKHFISESEVEKIYLKKVDIPTPVDTSNFLTKDKLNTLRPLPTLSINNNTLSITGGNSVVLPNNQWEIHGTGMPNGVVEAEIGTTYVDKNKTNGALKWIKTTDGGNTGWKVAEGDTGWVLGWQENMGNNKNRMYFRRKNDIVHVKFEPEINSSSIRPETNLILKSAGYESEDDLSIQGFQPIDDVFQTIYDTSSNIYPNTFGAENSEGSQGCGAVIIQYEYTSGTRKKSRLKLQIITSLLGVDENHVNPFSYLTEDEWPTQLP